MPAGAWLKQQEALAVVGGADFAYLAHIYVTLLSGQPTDADSSIAGLELSGTGYARVATTPPSDWTTPAQSGVGTPYTSSNVNAISFGNAGAAWGTATWFAWMTASSGGHLVAYGQLSAPLVVVPSLLVEFAAGALVASFS